MTKTVSEFRSESAFTIGEHETCWTALNDTVRDNPGIVLFSRPQKFEWVDVTGEQFLEEVRAVAKGLIAHGVEHGDRVVIMSETRYEWSLMDLACMAAGVISVPIYSSSSSSQCQWIVEDSGAVLAISEGPSHTERLARLIVKPGEEGSKGNSQLREVFEINSGGIDALIKDGKNIPDSAVEERVKKTKSSDVASFVYTSGTTGRPKGCMLLHSNWLGEARGIATHPIGAQAEPGRRVLTFLPLAHVFSRAVSMAVLVAGTTQNHWSDFNTLVPEFQRSKPNLILGVPRVFEKVQAGIRSNALDKGGITAKIFLRAEKTAIAYSHALDTDKGPGLALRGAHALYDRLVFKKIREALGNEVGYCISGGSALNTQIMHFLRGAGVDIFEGYGLTESTAAFCVNYDPDNIIGTVGKPLPGHTVRVAEDGELLLKGPVVFSGYWQNEEATAEAFDEDGFFHTGDLGEIYETGHIKITGRKKEIIVTAGGKNVSPGPLEDILRSAPLISQAMVVGNDRKFVGCLISLDEQAIQKWKTQHNIPENTPVSELAKNPLLRAEIQDAINEANATVSHAESIKKFRIVHRDFSEEEGEVTPSMKLKRFVVAKNFHDDIAWIYKGD